MEGCRTDKSLEKNVRLQDGYEKFREKWKVAGRIRRV